MYEHDTIQSIASGRQMFAGAAARRDDNRRRDCFGGLLLMG